MLKIGYIVLLVLNTTLCIAAETGNSTKYLDVTPETKGQTPIVDVVMLVQPTDKDRIGLTVTYKMPTEAKYQYAQFLCKNTRGNITTMIWLKTDPPWEDGKSRLINNFDRSLVPSGYILIGFSDKVESPSYPTVYCINLKDWPIK